MLLDQLARCRKEISSTLKQGIVFCFAGWILSLICHIFWGSFLPWGNQDKQIPSRHFHLDANRLSDIPCDWRERPYQKGLNLVSISHSFIWLNSQILLNQVDGWTEHNEAILWVKHFFTPLGLQRYDGLMLTSVLPAGIICLAGAM